MNWYHQEGLVRGLYDPVEMKIRLDYRALLSNPLQAELTWVHENVHAQLGLATDFGIGSCSFFQHSDIISKIDKQEINQISNLLYNSQHFVQEGFATFMQYSIVKMKYGKTESDNWAFQNVNQTYYDYLQRLYFATQFSKKYRELFTSKIPFIALNNGLRSNAKPEKLFDTFENLNHYLIERKNAPDIRLNHLIKAIKNNERILTYNLDEIAEEANIPYFPDATNEDVAGYYEYFFSLTDQPKTINPADVGEPLSGDQIFSNMYENLIVGNLNLNFVQSSEIIYTIDDYLPLLEKMECILVGVTDSKRDYFEFIKSNQKEEPEISFIGFVPIRGEASLKYILYLSKKTAEEFLKNLDKRITTLVKYGGYDIETDNYTWSKTTRKPDVVIYNNPKSMNYTLVHWIENNKNLEFQYHFARAMEDSPLHTLLLNIRGKTPLLTVNDIGNKNISGIIKVLKKQKIL